MGDKGLYKGLNIKNVLILAFSTMIGWGWVSLTGAWVVEGGTIGAAIAFFLGAVLCVFVGLTYSELTPMFPYAGGEIVFSYEALGYHASWFTGWMITFAYIGVAAWEGPALATAIDYLVTIPRYGYIYTVAGFDVYISWLIIPAVMGGLLIFINFKGIRVSAIFQTIVTAILSIGGIAFAVVSVIEGDIRNAQPLVTSPDGVFSVLLAVPAMFVGFDVIPQVAEEMNLPLRKIPKAIIASICIAAAWYMLMILSAGISAPVHILSAPGVTVANALNYATKGTYAGKLIIVTAIMGILSSWNGFIIGATRVLFSMGHAGMLPAIFGTLHKKHRTPFFSTVFVGAITMIAPFSGKNSLGWFVNASSFGTVVAYFMVAISFVVLRVKRPDIKRPFMIKNGMAVGVAAIIVSVLFLFLYLPIGPGSLAPIEWTIVGGWLFLGVILYLFSLKRQDKNKDIKICD